MLFDWSCCRVLLFGDVVVRLCVRLMLFVVVERLLSFVVVGVCRGSLLCVVVCVRLS